MSPVRATCALLALFALLLSTSTAAADDWPKEAAFDREPEPPEGYAQGQWFEETPADGARLAYHAGGYSIPVTWSFLGDPRDETGRTPAWTSEGAAVRFTRPDGGWTEVHVRDEAWLVVDTSSGTHHEYGGAAAPMNYTRADFDSCVRSDGDVCERYADDHRFRTPANFLARVPGTYRMTLTLTDVDGGVRVHETRFTIVPRPPSAPRDLVAAPSSASGDVTLLWSPPQDDGGLPVLRYVVYRDGQAVAEVEGRTWTDTLPATGRVTYTVAAVNGAGEGAASEPAHAVAVRPGLGLRVEAEARVAGRSERVAVAV